MILFDPLHTGNTVIDMPSIAENSIGSSSSDVLESILMSEKSERNLVLHFSEVFEPGVRDHMCDFM